MRTPVDVADLLYLIVHDPISGQPCAAPRVTGMGLTAGLICDLVLSEHVTLKDGAVWVLDGTVGARIKLHSNTFSGACQFSLRRIQPHEALRRCPGGCPDGWLEDVPDPVGWEVLGLMARERSRWTVREWANVLADTAPQAVAERLTTAGFLKEHHIPRLLRPPRVSWLPVDTAVSAMPRIRMETCAQHPDTDDVIYRVLGGLTHAMGLDPLISPAATFMAGQVAHFTHQAGTGNPGSRERAQAFVGVLTQLTQACRSAAAAGRS